ncbi:thaumatin-like protein 1 [Panicum virgatum]|uniref:thaumatin-like protein 1 n=1 Tax=Panicum virgatum TaxID=38727 RepID=UPI0019D5D1D5|nr:thaumatin-like protein 1 [Panicum virgatum]
MGDCGSGDLECHGGGAATPATLAKFMPDGSGGPDFFDVSLMDGYNLPMAGAAGCTVELNAACPTYLRVGGGVVCRSACDSFRDARYYCSSAGGVPPPEAKASAAGHSSVAGGDGVASLGAGPGEP